MPLAVIIAREAPVGLIFRRGPTKQVQMIRWNLHDDTFAGGQWLAGRVYPERCDLSPDGRFVVYFGMRRGDTWTAVSWLPYFTPLAVWEESGTWGGGGRWLSNTELRLSTNPRSLKLAPDFTLPDWLTVKWRADDPAEPGRVLNAWTWQQFPESSPAQFVASRQHPKRAELALQRWRSIVVDEDTDEAREMYRYQIEDRSRTALFDAGSYTWADWHPSGDLVYADGMRLLRAPFRHDLLGEPTVLADFADATFEKLPPPDFATRWPS